MLACRNSKVMGHMTDGFTHTLLYWHADDILVVEKQNNSTQVSHNIFNHQMDRYEISESPRPASPATIT